VHENAIENILAALTDRFSQRDAHTGQPTLEAIADLERLKEVHLATMLFPDFQTFLQTFEA